MVTAIILMKVARDHINDVGQQIVDIEGVTEVFSVGGRYDLVTIVRTKDNEAIADFVTQKLSKITGIQDTETLWAFKTYSNYDLERMFSIGAN